jgi:uncharacterized protein YkvS
MRILNLVWPYQGTNLHTNHSGMYVMLAPDQISSCLAKLGHQVVYCNVADDKIRQVTHCSNLPIYNACDISNWSFDLVWHCIKDPTPSNITGNVIELTNRVTGCRRVLNNISVLKDWTKPMYYRLLNDGFRRYVNDRNLITPMVKDAVTSDTDMTIPDRNNDRDLNSRRIIVEYVDNIVDGKREFFRMPYCRGKFLKGCLYRCGVNKKMPKTGDADERVEFELTGSVAGIMSNVLMEAGLDMAHVEGFSNKDSGLNRIFDINPFPCSDGKTFNPMSYQIAKRLECLYAI